MTSPWWEPFAGEGEVEVLDRVDAVVRERILATGDGGPLEVATIELPGGAVRIRIGKGLCEALAGETVVAALQLETPAPWHIAGSLLDEELSVQREADKSRGSLIRGPLLFWAISAGEQAWSWHYEDAANAADAILSAGPRPGAEPLVITTPGGLTAAQRTDLLAKRRLVARWGAGARPVDVVLATSIDLLGLGDVVRSRPIRAFDSGLRAGLSLLRDDQP